MRNFASIPPTLWQTDIKKLRGDTAAIAVHYHLTTSPHSTMIGIYPLSLDYLAIDLGIPLEGASKGLRRVIDAGLCSYDDENEIVWMHDMAVAQVAPRLSPKDNRVSAVAKQLAMLPICRITLGFYARFREIYHLQHQLCLEEFERAFRGASEPLRSKEKEKEKEKEQDKDLGTGKGKIGSEGEELGSAHAREDEPELPYEQPSTVEEGRLFLVRLGVPASRMQEGMQRLMREALFPCDVEQWKLETLDRQDAAA